MPSPQTMEHSDGVLMQLHPDSIWQVKEHPSEIAKFPSSHYSLGASTIELLQELQVEGVP